MKATNESDNTMRNFVQPNDVSLQMMRDNQIQASDANKTNIGGITPSIGNPKISSNKQFGFSGNTLQNQGSHKPRSGSVKMKSATLERPVVSGETVIVPKDGW